MMSADARRQNHHHPANYVTLCLQVQSQVCDEEQKVTNLKPVCRRERQLEGGERGAFLKLSQCQKGCERHGKKRFVMSSVHSSLDSKAFTSRKQKSHGKT